MTVEHLASLTRGALGEVRVDVKLLVELRRSLVISAVTVEGHGLDEGPHLKE